MSSSAAQGSAGSPLKSPVKIIVASIIILASVAWLAVSAGQANKSYNVTITELQGMGNKAYVRHLRVAGNVAPGSIHRMGGDADFSLLEQGKVLKVVYRGSEPPPDTFKDDAQALAIGTYGRDGVFHATQLQAKCASKYAPAPGSRPGQPTPASAAANAGKTAALVTPAIR
jgi:cytochrome c-type biogenesis protein CcmE